MEEGGSERMGGRPEQSAASGVREPHLACGILLPQREELLVLLLQLLVAGTDRQAHSYLTLCEWSMMTLHVRPLHRDLKALHHLG